MRDPNRLDEFYKELAQIHKENFPDWRFGQFITNFLAWYGKDPFYLEEKKFMQEVNRYVNDITNRGQFIKPCFSARLFCIFLKILL